jgi:hypothetical protein
MNFVETVRAILRREGMTGVVVRANGPEPPLDGQPDLPPYMSPESPKLRPVPGCWIEWKSPLFGLLTGQVLDADQAHIMVWHPKADGLRNIPVNWVTRTLTAPKKTGS